MALPTPASATPSMPTPSSIPPQGRVLGLDWGGNRIGLAITDALQILATPLEVLRQRAGKRPPLGAFLTVVEREAPVGIVAGLPLDDHGREGEAARAARQMAELFASRAALPLSFLDESFTTSESRLRLMARGVSPNSRSEALDAMAAAVLLERWIAARSSEPEGPVA
jgi:putative Holliday junction resolvase